MDDTLNTVIWFELWVSDVEPAKAFYGALFGWTFSPMAEYDPGYWLIDAGGGRGTIGALWAVDATPTDAGAVVYVAVADLNDAIARAEALGAQVARWPTAIPDGTSFAWVRDPVGSLLGLWAAGAGNA